jgi:hypothetical protein
MSQPQPEALPGGKGGTDADPTAGVTELEAQMKALRKQDTARLGRSKRRHTFGERFIFVAATFELLAPVAVFFTFRKLELPIPGGLWISWLVGFPVTCVFGGYQMLQSARQDSQPLIAVLRDKGDTRRDVSPPQDPVETATKLVSAIAKLTRP